MDYRAAFMSPLEHPKWGLNILLLAVCFLIPVVGPIVAIGYLARCKRAKCQTATELLPTEPQYGHESPKLRKNRYEALGDKTENERRCRAKIGFSNGTSRE